MFIKVHQTDGKPRYVNADAIQSFAASLHSDNGQTAIHLTSGAEVRIVETVEWLVHHLECSGKL